jgi:hypothetical protein
LGSILRDSGIFSLVTILQLQFTIFLPNSRPGPFFITITRLVAFLKNYKTELPDIILLGKIRICDGWHGGQNENRVKYGFVTVRDLLPVRAICGVRGIRKLP